MVGLEVDDFGFIEEEDNNEISLSVPSIDNIIPSKGLFLGLDISKNSTGITYIENGERITGNIRLEDQEGVHKEVLLRRALKNDLRELVEGKEFDLIVIEDAFVGENAETVRLLFALNTAIDEMILDGICSVKEFLRVSNQTWKSWLSVLDTEGVTKGFNDKEKIRMCLEMIGVTDEGEGYQDRLDSTGLIVSYFLKGKELADKGKLVKKRKVRLSDIDSSYDVDSSYLLFGRDEVNRDNIVFLDYKKISKSRVIELLTDSPESVFVTSQPVLLGNLGIDLGLDIIDGGGYFAFWVKPNKLKKYL
ncbi:hypothetical protein ACEE21_14825 [Clostridium baratii]